MSKENGGNKKYQLNMFCGNQSFIVRLDSPKQIGKFMGVKKIGSEGVAEYLQRLQTDMGKFDGTMIQVPVKKGKPSAKGLDSQHYIDQLRNRLISLGARTAAQQQKALFKASGKIVKSIKKLSAIEAQALLACLLRGDK